VGTPFYESLKVIQDTVNALSGGRFVLELHPGGAIVPAYQEFLGLHEGALDWGSGNFGAVLGTIPLGSIYHQNAARLPPYPYYVFLKEQGADIANKWIAAKGFDVMDLAGFGATPINPPEIFLQSTKELNTPADFKGMKIRTFGYGGLPFEQWGAALTMLPAAELYEATQRGVLDAFEMSNFKTNYDFGYHEVTKYIYISPIRAPSEHGMHPAVKKSSWEALPDEFKLLFASVAQAEEVNFGIRMTMAEGPTAEKMREYGCVVQMLPMEIVEAYAALYDDAMTGTAADKPDMKEMLEAQRAWAVMWNDIEGLPSWSATPEEWRQY
jgi:TRAP-type mannitol/chloroaromatic compound transport system substrate-binding protein